MAAVGLVWAPQSPLSSPFSFSASVREEGDGRRVRRLDVEVAHGEGPDGGGKQGPLPRKSAPGPLSWDPFIQTQPLRWLWSSFAKKKKKRRDLWRH